MLVSDFVKICESNTKYIFFLNEEPILNKPSSGLSILRFFPYVIKNIYIQQQGVVAINLIDKKDTNGFEIHSDGIKLPNNIYRISEILPLITKDNVNTNPQNIINDNHVIRITPFYDFNCFGIV